MLTNKPIYGIGAALLSGLFFASCGTNNPLSMPSVSPVTMRDVPAQRLNYRFEPDVPGPSTETKPVPVALRNEAVQADFDTNRPQEILDRTIPSPDNSKLAVVYRDISDLVSEFRLDIYSADGKLVKKVTHDEMAVHFPDTIVWSPDSSTLAFVAMVRAVEGMPPAVKDPLEGAGPEELEKKEAEAAPDAEVPANGDPQAAQENVITFRTEQIYICDSNGGDLKPLTKNEGLMYFYFAWSPDGSALAALATSITEWRIRQARMANAGEVFVPEGRPRLVEKNGRERLLDDFSTTVHPVWSPDSSKVAVAFDKQIRIYDAIGERPTQAAIPLNNDLLLASKAYEDKKKEEEGPGALATPAAPGNTAEKEEPTPDENSNANVQRQTSTLPDASTLVSFNPIIDLQWTDDTMLYLQTGYLKNYIDAAENVASFVRWHRLILSPQAVVLQNANSNG